MLPSTIMVYCVYRRLSTSHGHCMNFHDIIVCQLLHTCSGLVINPGPIPSFSMLPTETSRFSAYNILKPLNAWNGPATSSLYIIDFIPGSRAEPEIKPHLGPTYVDFSIIKQHREHAHTHTHMSIGVSAGYPP